MLQVIVNNFYAQKFAFIREECLMPENAFDIRKKMLNKNLTTFVKAAFGTHESNRTHAATIVN